MIEHKYKPSPFLINTGNIYRLIVEQWETDKKTFSREFLKDEFCPALKGTLLYHAIITVPPDYDGLYNDITGYPDRAAIKPKNFEYLNKHKIEQDKFNQFISEGTDNFAMLNYYMARTSPYKDDSLTSLEDDCIVEKTDAEFPLFFFLKLYFTNEFDIYEYLNFHLLESFKDDQNKFIGFLEILILKFQKFLTPLTIDLSRKYIDRLGKKQVFENSSLNKEATIGRQVLAMHYLFDNLGIWDNIETNKSDIARFIEFLTGKGYVNIYKAVKTPLKQKEHEFSKDIKHILPYFQTLGLTEIVKKMKGDLKAYK